MTSDMGDAVNDAMNSDMPELSPPIACGQMCEVITGRDCCNPDAWVALGARISAEVDPTVSAEVVALILWTDWRMRDPDGDHWTYCERTPVESVLASIDYLEERVEFYEKVPAAAAVARELRPPEPDPYEVCEQQLRRRARDRQPDMFDPPTPPRSA